MYPCWFLSADKCSIHGHTRCHHGRQGRGVCGAPCASISTFLLIGNYSKVKVFYFFKALAQKDRAWGPSANREGEGLQLSKTAAATAVRDLNSLVPKPLAEAEEGEMKTTVQGEGRKENEVRNAFGPPALRAAGRGTCPRPCCPWGAGPEHEASSPGPKAGVLQLRLRHQRPAGCDDGNVLRLCCAVSRRWLLYPSGTWLVELV